MHVKRNKDEEMVMEVVENVQEESKDMAVVGEIGATNEDRLRNVAWTAIQHDGEHKPPWRPHLGSLPSLHGNIDHFFNDHFVKTKGVSTHFAWGQTHGVQCHIR